MKIKGPFLNVFDRTVRKRPNAMTAVLFIHDCLYLFQQYTQNYLIKTACYLSKYFHLRRMRNEI